MLLYIVFLLSFLGYSLQSIETVNFYVLNLYPGSLLNLFIGSNRSVCLYSLGFSTRNIEYFYMYHLGTEIVLLLFPFGCLVFIFLA